MPIIHFINSKTQTAGGMKNVLAYVTRTEKTQSEDKQYVTALNCTAPTAYEEMIATKNTYHKNSGRMYYHLVQSFPKGDDTQPELAHRIAVELAEKAFGKYECVVATHIDREHIHSHIVFNSVSFEDGRKYHSNGNTVQELMDLSDEICMRYGVTVLDKQPQKKKDVFSDREYRSAVRGESWKFQLMNAITEVMKQAKSKKQFVFMMKQLGYGVRWEDSRKYITYTCPNGRKCRCAKLHGELMTRSGIEMHLQNQKVLFDQVENECRRIQKSTAEQTTNSLTSLISRSEKLSLQAGKLNEEFSLQRRELEEWKHRTQLKMLRAIVISQSVLLILSLVLQMWLR